MNDISVLEQRIAAAIRRISTATEAVSLNKAAPAPTPPSYIPDLVLIRDRLKTALAAAGR